MPLGLSFTVTNQFNGRLDKDTVATKEESCLSFYNQDYQKQVRYGLLDCLKRCALGSGTYIFYFPVVCQTQKADTCFWHNLC